MSKFLVKFISTKTHNLIKMKSLELKLHHTIKSQKETFENKLKIHITNHTFLFSFPGANLRITSLLNRRKGGFLFPSFGSEINYFTVF